MRTLTSVLIIVLLLASCGKRQSRIAHDTATPVDSLTIDSIAADTSKILIAGLPLCFEKTDYIMHPVGWISLNERSGKRNIKFGSYSESDYSSSGFSAESYREDQFTCNVTNFVFESINTHAQSLLTDKVLKILNVQYLRELSEKTDRHYILYSVIDNDINHDNELDYQDISSLYISRIDGSSFKKITDNFHEYDGGKMIIQELKYYFRTIEDIDRDGDFSKNDKYHYYYIDFSADDYKLTEYYPLKLITN